MVLNRHFQQQPVIHPETRPEITARNLKVFETDAFRDIVAARLTGSVQIPTVTYDSMGHVGKDPDGISSMNTRIISRQHSLGCE